MAFATTLRPALLAAARSSRIERALTTLPVSKKVVSRFVPGPAEADAIAASGDILNSGRYVSIDYLGEDTTDVAQATQTVQHYLTLLPALGELAGPEGHSPRRIEVSLKLSALGQFLSQDGHQIALDNARAICAAAEEAGAWVTVDAEDHTTTDSTLEIVTELRRDFPTLGTVLQAYLKRTEGDCRDLSGAGSRIRLCKGAYKEPSTVAYQTTTEVDAAYVRCLRILMSGEGYPMAATHDPAMVSAALRLAEESGRSSDQFELQMLYGIRDAEQRRLIASGAHLRVYVPYGDEWYGYFVRRLAERPANLTFFVKSLTSTR